MSMHEQFAEDLALYALGTLPEEGRSVLEKHLESCADCRHELEQLRGDTVLLALSAAGPKPPQRSRERLMNAITREPRFPREKFTRENLAQEKLKPAPRRAWWGIAGWVAAAAMALVAFGFWGQDQNSQRQIASLTQAFQRQQAQLEKALEVVDTLTATDAMRITLVAAKTPPQPQGKAIYVRDRSSLIFMASNMPKLPPQKAYELWLIPKQGAPIPAGVFQPDARGSATVVNPPLPAGADAKAFAITVEPEAGSTTPTMPIVMLGAGE
jgi:anti-sigma-K factor RskA